MNALVIQEGTIYNYLTIISEAEPKTIDGLRPKRQFLCSCICGRTLVVRLDALRNNKKSSCGCQMPIPIVKTGNPITKHGLSYHPLYKIWKKIRRRCYCVTDPSYFRYGKRGIVMSANWYASAEDFYKWSMENGYVFGLELDRIDNDKGYFPENCRWTTSEINNNNKRNNIKYAYNGGQYTLPQISRMHGGISFSALYRRVNELKMPLKEALDTPKYARCKKGLSIRLVLTPKQAVEIYNSEQPTKVLCAKYNVHKSTIDGIRSGTRYRAIINPA